MSTNKLEESDGLPRFTVLYKDGEAVASIVKNEKLFGTFFFVVGTVMRDEYKNTERNHCRVYEYESYGSRLDGLHRLKDAYNEALNAADRDLGAKPLVAN